MLQSLCLECFVFLTRPGWLFFLLISLSLISCFLVWSVLFLWCYAPMSVTCRKTSSRNITGIFQYVTSIFLKEIPPPLKHWVHLACCYCCCCRVHCLFAWFVSRTVWPFEHMLSRSFGLSLACYKAVSWLTKEDAHGLLKPKIRSWKSLRKEIKKSTRKTESQACLGVFIT